MSCAIGYWRRDGGGACEQVRVGFGSQIAAHHKCCCMQTAVHTSTHAVACQLLQTELYQIMNVISRQTGCHQNAAGLPFCAAFHCVALGLHVFMQCQPGDTSHPECIEIQGI